MSREGQTYGEYLRSKQISYPRKATPTRTPSLAKAAGPRHNSWEAGIPTDERGMPYLDERLMPIGNKKFAQTYRRKHEEARRQRAQGG